jgi:hypothetical protein
MKLVLVKLSLCRPEQALRAAEGLDFQDFYKIGTRKWPDCQLHTSAAFTPGDIPGNHCCKKSSRHQGHNAEVLIQLGIEPATVWLPAQCLKQQRYCAIAYTL